MRIGSLFTGYGGLDMAVQKVFPHSTLEWISEVDPHANILLQKRFPDTLNLGDVTEVLWTEVPNVDIIVGGSPCQDLSLAGTRLGIGSGTQSGLWESMALAIAAKRPALVLWENVLGATSAKAFCDLGWTAGLLDERRPEEKPAKEDRPLRALGRVLGDLTNLGYDAVWTTVRASERGGVHHRARVFVLAYPSGNGREESELAQSFGEEDTATDNYEGLPANPEVFGEYAPTIDRWAEVLGRPAPMPENLAPDGEPRLNTRFVEWMMGLPEGWVTDVGLPYTAEIRLLGNGVVPEQGAHALRQLLGEITQ